MQLSRRWKTIAGTACALALGAWLLRSQKAVARSDEAEDLAALAEEAYVYGYPLVLLDVTGRVMTNVPAPEGARAPLNQMARVDVLPDARFKLVVMPNVDTLYTNAVLDLDREPIVLHVPDTRGRYYVMQMMDAYTNVFAAPGKRTTGTSAQDFVIVGPGWNGTLPSGVKRIDAPTRMVTLIGRTQINGKQDLPAVVAITNQYTLTPLSFYGHPYSPPKSGATDPNIDMVTSPPRTVAAMTPEAYFTRLSALLEKCPPLARDRAALARFARLGLAPGHFSPAPDVRPALDGVAQRALARMQAHARELGTREGGWNVDTKVGEYGTRYLDRATVAHWGLGANLARDAVYPGADTDDKGNPLNGSKRYVLHFAKGDEPPVNAFWSLTLYGMDGYLVANPIHRYAIGDRDSLVRNADGSLDILIQHDAPSGTMAANWLPAPEGRFKLLLRMYWPKEPILDGKWLPPPLQQQSPRATRTAPPPM